MDPDRPAARMGWMLAHVTRTVALSLTGLSLVTLSLGGCVSTGMPRGVAATTPRFDAIDFFDGHHEGVGILKIAMREPSATRVHGSGHRDGDSLMLVQRVEQGGKPDRRRTWRLTRVASDRWEGTLTDAKGPVVATARGNALDIAYEGEAGAIRQTIRLDPDGRVAHNHLTVRKLGVIVAVLEETIRKIE